MKKTIDNIRKSIRFLDIKKSKIFIIVIIGIISSLVYAIIPTINGLIINNILKLNYSKIIVFAIIAGIFQMIVTFCNYLVNKNYFRLKENLTLNMRKELCNSLMNLNSSSYSDEGLGKLLNKIKKDSNVIASFFYDMKEGFLSLIFSIGIIIYMIYLNYIIGIYYIIVILISIFIRYIGVKKSIIYKKISIDESDLNDNNLSQMINGQKDIKVNNLKEKLLRKNDLQLKKISDSTYQSNYSNELYSSLANFSESFFSGIMVILSIFLLQNDLLTTEVFVIIFMYRGTVFLFPKKFAITLNETEKFNISVDRVYSILNAQSENYGHLDVKVNGDIKFNNVSFYYKSNAIILDNLSFLINKNTLTIIIGKNGIGKSTILNLIDKVIVPVKGNIMIDNYPLNDLSEKSIRENIVLITQQPYLFNVSIYENLSLVSNDKKKIIDTCKMVGIHDKIMSFPDGYQTKIGSDACRLSGGEKQKIAIARALLSNAKILLLDEITNNLDQDSTISITNLICRLKKKYTIIMVTHNKDILDKADQIIEIKNAKKIVVKK